MVDRRIDRDGPAVVLEAILHSEQLSDVRHILGTRLCEIPMSDLWRIVTATNELATNALVHAGRCLGLRVYVLGRSVRVEVDDPSPVRIPIEGLSGGLAIVASVATRWGDQVPGPVAAGGGHPLRPPAAKTVWCEIEL